MKTIKSTLFIVAGIFLLLMTGCHESFTIRGNGIEQSENRYVSSFSKINSSGAFIVHVTPGDEYEVVVNAESNILPYIETDSYGNTLKIHIRGFHNVKNQLPMEVFVTTPYLEGLKESGSGIITTGYFESESMDISISGSGRIETAVDCRYLEGTISGSGVIYISGVATTTNFNISGSGKIDAFDLETNNCVAHISGSGDVLAQVSNLLDASISGSGNVFYIGDPEIRSSISGSGKIIQE